MQYLVIIFLVFVIELHAYISSKSINLHQKSRGLPWLSSTTQRRVTAIKMEGSCPYAPKCNGEYRSKGCDGTGKISGGIGTVLTWWPIKVYRPCPSYMAAGYIYRREGQTLDQVLFSEPSTKMKEKIDRENKRRNQERQDFEALKAEAAATRISSDSVSQSEVNKTSETDPSK